MKKRTIAMAMILALVWACASCAPAGEFYVEDETPGDFAERVESLADFSAEAILGEPVFFGEVKTAERAAECAEQVWSEVYGEDAILRQRPYRVQYDKISGIWCVCGDGAYLQGACGGVAVAYIARDDGELLAIVHGE